MENEMILLDILSEESLSSSASEDNIETNVVSLITAESLGNTAKTENFVEETVPLYSEEQFLNHFRVSRRIVEKLKVEFELSDYYPKKDTGYQRISSEKSVLAFLWFASNEAVSLRDVADRFNISISTLHSIVDRVTKFISNKSPGIITWPSPEECRNITMDFENMGFPGVIGCIDGSHVQIDTPKDDAESYVNRKKYHSIQMQVVCDNTRKIRDVFIGYPGSVHDARVFRNSTLGQNIQQKCRGWVILGDSAYPCLRNLLTPYKDTGNLLNVQKRYNRKLSHCRVLIEHTIGLLKQRFRQLYHIKSRNIEFICHFIRACCVLHNICMDENIYLEQNVAVDEAPDNHELQDEQDEDEPNEMGANYRNYVASILDI